MTATWRVGAILNESLADTLRFSAWYLEQGASGLTLLFDNPQDPAIGVLDSHPLITCVRCTAAFWDQLGHSQDVRFTKRQNAGLNWIYRQTGEDWLLNVDGDEFLYVPERSIADLLNGLPPELEALRVETAEIVAPLSQRTGQVFRLPMDRDAARRVYRDDAPLFGPRRKGLVGHSAGKSLIRVGLEGVSLRQHWAERGRGNLLDERFIGREDKAYLLHLIGLDPEAWRRKLDWRLGARGFTVPLSERIRAAMASENSVAELHDLHQRLHCLDNPAIDRLRSENCVLEVAIDLDANAKKHFGTSFSA
ncbi:MAG: glycosyltransferase family 2 protein [Pseudomonadota bacterium]